MAVDVPTLRKPTNVEIFNAIRGVSTVDYQRRIPAADKSNVQDTINGLLRNRPSMNEFVDGFVNRIGMEIYRSKSWTNPLAKFKIGMLEYGDTIEEYMVGLIEAKRYDSDTESLEKAVFGQERIRTDVSYHKINRQDKYKLTVLPAMIRRAFQTEYGLNNLITQLMNAPQTSDNWDEFLLMSSMFKEYWRADGFFKINVPDFTTITGDGGEAAKLSLRRMRESAENLQFISERYNAAGMPTAADPDELELFITPEALAAQDVEALAGAFNIDKANFSARSTVIPQEHFNIPGAMAVLTTRDFFVVADTLLESTQIQNPDNLSYNYWLHHHGVISASRYVPAILFTTEPGTVINLDNTPVQSVAVPVVADSDGNTVTSVERGELYTVTSGVTTAPAGGVNDAYTLTLVGAQSANTRITPTGVLIVAVDEAATSLTINVNAVDTDASGEVTNTLTVGVTGDRVIEWPNRVALPDADNDGLNEVTPEPVTKDADDNVTIPNVTGVQYKQDGTTVNNGSVHHITAPSTFTAVARANYELAAGAVTSWTINP